MRVFYIGKFNHPHSTENYVSWALRQLGVEVIRQHLFRHLTGHEMRDTVKSIQPDVVLFSKPHLPWFVGFLEWLRKADIPSVSWIWDLYFGYRPAIPPQFRADLVLTTDGGHPQHWEAMGVDHRVLRQGIHQPEYQMITGQIQDTYAFVGSHHGSDHRVTLVKYLRKSFAPDIRFHTQLRGLPLNRKLGRTAVVIGDSYPSPHYWSNRIYEIIGRGGFLLHPEVEGLDEEFEDGVHYVSYPRFEKGTRGLSQAVNKYTNDTDARERIRKQGFRQCRKYTYTKRCETLLGMIEEKFGVKHALLDSGSGRGSDAVDGQKLGHESNA